MELNSAAAAAVRLQQQQAHQQATGGMSTTPPAVGMNASSSLFPAFNGINADTIDSMGE